MTCDCAWCDPPCENPAMADGEAMCGECFDGQHRPDRDAPVRPEEQDR